MSASSLDKFKVDHLFLLIGKNPLPNYVAAKLLVNKDGTVYLVHTRDTEEAATRLTTILREEEKNLQSIELISLGDHESDGNYISTEINSALDDISTGKIGLNYTGGTKPMSVNAYRTLFYEEIKENNGSRDKKYKLRKNITFSYVNPRGLEMCIYRENEEIDPIKIKPDTLQIKLETLFKLHGLQLNNTPITDPKSPNLTKALAQVFSIKMTKELWTKRFYKHFLEQIKSNTFNDSNNDFKNQVIAIANEGIQKFKQDNELTTNFMDSFDKVFEELIKEIQEINTFSELKEFCEWLNGGFWFEHYVLDKVKKISPSEFIKENHGMTFKIPLKGTKDGFELDIAFIRGYQLFAISCTVSDNRGTCKEKLFEAYLRARQMGGDEARVILVCCSDEPDSIKAEIGNLLDQRKIAVFGREHLINLSVNISDWIKQKDEEVGQ